MPIYSVGDLVEWRHQREVTSSGIIVHLDRSLPMALVLWSCGPHARPGAKQWHPLSQLEVIASHTDKEGETWESK